mgnify:CR=1 FL=1|jgi:hypothetical protein
MRRLICALVFTGIAGLAHAKDVYLYDLLQKPAYAASWKAALASGKAVPAWIRDDNRYVAMAAKTVTIDSIDYSVSVIAQQHATNQGQAAVMFNPDGTQVWVEIQEDGKADRFLGVPSEAQKQALGAALR